jgi:multicomponent Na+:H+ antiporter subunit F
VLSMVGFIGSVTIARFAAVEPPKGQQPDGTGSEAGPPGQDTPGQDTPGQEAP